jgi:subtilisin family serine protease
MYLWTGGMKTSVNPNPINPAADVITSSFGVFDGTPISGLMKNTFDLLTTKGRGGRGVLLFFSVGNQSQDFTLLRPWAAYDRTFAVAASALAADGKTETHDPTSNFDGGATIDFCAPAGNVTVADRTAKDSLKPDAPSRPTAQTTTTSNGVVGDKTLPVTTSAGFGLGQFIVIGPLNAAEAEFNRVMAAVPPNATNLTVSQLKRPHVKGSPVSTGLANSMSNFGGTSASTPLAAGVAALLLTVRPALTWIQIRDILRATAKRIDPANKDATGMWVDKSQTPSNQPGYTGPVYSRWYGFGRVDALEAVKRALQF